MALSAAIILAAGEGTRMRSNKPKVLHTLAGKTFLNRVMDSVAALDPDTLAVVVHYQAERVAEAARSYNEHVTIVDQDDIPCPDSSKRTDASHAPFRRRRKAFPTAAALSEPYLYNRGCVEIRSVLH